FYTKIENSGPATARIGIKGHAPLSQFLNSSFILQLRHENFIEINDKCIADRIHHLCMIFENIYGILDNIQK
ncbi:hypothetical protein ACTNCG_11685, partial [Catenibacterium mitsuokai]|uniref:hypothetical protein n=1 Tax=Catenibacterium mitsuokai TaxID=100886 RepID=UPI003F893008